MYKHGGREAYKAGELPKKTGEAPWHGVVEPWQDKYS